MGRTQTKEHLLLRFRVQLLSEGMHNIFLVDAVVKESPEYIVVSFITVLLV